MENTLRARVLLTLQIALLGAIGPAVRKVTCSWNAKEIRIRATFDGQIGEDDAEAMLETETEVMASFPGHDVSLVCEQFDAPMPVVMHADEQAVFARLEVVPHNCGIGSDHQGQSQMPDPTCRNSLKQGKARTRLSSCPNVRPDTG